MATHLADTSALGRLHHDDIAARVSPMFLGGRIATCAIVDLEVLRAVRSLHEHEEVWFERQLLPRAPIIEATTDRAIEVQGQLARLRRHRGVPISDLVIAAAAELAGLTVLHYDHDFDLIAEVTGQPAEWVVPRGTVP
ncbi:MAG: PIN domain nuclease [Acidimicrobiales bacterium]